MSILFVDSHASHAAVVKMMLSLGAYDILYYSDTRSAPFDELSGLTRVSRLLTLIDTHALRRPSAVVLAGKGMSTPPREAIEVGARKAGIELIYAADLLADHACSARSTGGLCLVGDSCLTDADVRGGLGRDALFEVRWSRITPIDPLDEPLKPILRHWAKSVGAYVVATPNNARVSAQIAREAPGAPVVDEHEHLGLALAAQLREGPSRRLEVCVTERTPAIVARLEERLGQKGLHVTEIGRMEAAPTSGPFSMSLEEDGSPA